jgi:hypothetical protein
MYLGKMTSSAENLEEFVDNAKRHDSKLLSFQCYFLYSSIPQNLEPGDWFIKKFKFDGGPSQGVLIGFLPIADKQTVLSEAKKLRQP